MIIVYCGDGKGKTSASVGQAIRALGQGMRVVFAQFMKRSGQAGEQKILQNLLQEDFFAGGAGFFRKEETRDDHRTAALEVLAWVRDRVASADVAVLDESLYALGSGLLEEDELRDILRIADDNQTHVVLSGRGLPEWLRERADIVTEMTLVKHAYASGVKAQRGIEF